MLGRNEDNEGYYQHDRGSRGERERGSLFRNEDDRDRRRWQNRDQERWRDQGSSEQERFGDPGYRATSYGSYGRGGMGRWDEEGSGQGRQRRGDDHNRYGTSFGDYGYSGSGGEYGSSYGRRELSQGRHSGRGPKGYQRSDERIKEDVCEYLSRHPEIDASEIEVQVRSGEVTLTGTVDNRREKRLAEDVIEDISGVKDVHNQIRVKAEQQGMQRGEQTQRSEQAQRGEQHTIQRSA